MGCCVSTVDTSKPHPHDPKNHHHHHPRSEVESRSPPAAEEETVKEVLSETPISKSHSPFLPPAESKSQIPTIQGHTFQFDHPQELFPTPQAPLSLEETKIRIPMTPSPPPPPPPERFDSKEDLSEASHLSEMCSVAESFSTTTTVTVGEKREDEVTSKRSSREATNQRPMWSNAPRKRPYTVDSASARERRSKSPARRVEPSPEKRNQGNPRTISGQTAARKPNAGPTGVRRDAGEKSGRRSRSPSTRLSQSRVNGGGRSQVKPPPPPPPVENKGMEEANDGVPPESIENPHVSMEGRDTLPSLSTELMGDCGAATPEGSTVSLEIRQNCANAGGYDDAGSDQRRVDLLGGGFFTRLEPISLIVLIVVLFPPLQTKLDAFHM